MPYADFVHLRVHSAYSLAEGAIKIKDLIKLCKAEAMPAVVVSDSGNLFGAMEFAMAAADDGIQPIIGCQLGISRTEPRGPTAAMPGKSSAPEPILLLVQTDPGYRNLMKLVSKAFLDNEPGTPPAVSLEALQGFSDGLIALTGGPGGPIGKALAEGRHPVAEATLAKLKALFPGRLYIELQRHGAGPHGEIEDRIEPDLIEMAYREDLPLVATNDCFFAKENHYIAQDALLCIADGAYVAQDDRRRLTPEHRFKSAAEMRALFADLPEAVNNTLVIARRCSFLLKPIKPILPAFTTEAGREEAAELGARAAEGLEARLILQVFTPELDAAKREDLAKPYRERLAFELSVIAGMKFPGYFLIVADFIQWAKKQGIPVGPGRGSGAGSVVAWALTITDLDPLRFGLLFERFLNPERVSMPDFDIDFCQERRDEVIRYVQGKYGSDRVAQIITFGKLQARAVLRDVGRVLQVPYGQVDRLSKLVPNNPANPVSLKDAIAGEPRFQEARREDETVGRLIDIALQLEGLYRHASTHAAGVVIGDRPLDELVPLYRDPRSDMPVTQFSMKYVELAGLVKFDFLGLKTLTVLRTAVELTGQEIDLAALPFDDPKTYAMLSRAETTGVFQLESSGMRDVLRKMKPNRFEDIIALVALYRPGPMDNIPKYIKVKNKEEQPDYLHPSLEGILKETFGIMIYQEQVMQIAQVLAGYSLGGADLLRRAMGKKDQKEMDAQRHKFIDGAAARGVESAQAGMIFDQVNKFAGYGFNKSHAAAYALVAYQTAWMKANHPVEFLASSMTYDMGVTDKLNVFRQELERIGIRLLGPDVNNSRDTFAVEMMPDGTKAIRYALAAIKGVGQAAMKGVVAEREAKGRFANLFDFARRLDTKAINKRQLEGLACAGAFDALNSNRSQVFGAVETLTRYAQAAVAERDSGQASLFGVGGASGGGAGLREPPLAAGPDWDTLDKLKHEFDAIGFFLSAHPLDVYAGPLRQLKVVRSADLAARLRGGGSSRYQIAGIVVSKKEKIAKSGNRFAFVTLSDASGVYEVTMFSEVLTTCRDRLEPGTALLLSVDVQNQNDELRLTAQDVKSLEEEAAKVSDGLKVVVRDTTPIAGLRDLVAKFGRGRSTLHVVIETDALGEIEIVLPGAYALTVKNRPALRSIPGVLEIREL
ncbi:DNA polymerase III subunit alpha [uncultured Gammaproteobacteria bacterium]